VFSEIEKKMTTLIIDTSTEQCLIALTQGGQLLSELAFPHLNLLSKNLLPSVQGLLKDNGVAPSDLSFIAAGIGPGSYTGTRLGCAVAKTLAFGLGIGVKPFHSPLAFLPNQEGSFAFLLPTRARLYYILKGVCSPQGVTQQSATLISAEALISETQDVDFLVCSSTHILPEELCKKNLYTPSPNLSALCLSLQFIETLPPEKIELQYLHTP
jgi:tRNA threonylcarbamoyladenosine biosynthesis protein TsaB